jgi:hypothetical protein
VISDQRLYHASYRNFDAYLTERWPELGHRNYVHKMIRAARVAHELGTNVPNGAPATEGQVRPLLALKDPDARLRAWQHAGEQAQQDGRAAPTARDVAAAVQVVRRAPPPASGPQLIGRCPTCRASFPLHTYGLAPSHCPTHGQHYVSYGECPDCRAERRQREGAAARVDHLQTAAATFQRYIAQQYTLWVTFTREVERQPLAEMWPLIPLDQQHALLDWLTDIAARVASVEERITNVEGSRRKRVS